MKQILRSVTAMAFLSIIASAQYGSAPNNYYPADYTGSIFTGTVTETSGPSFEVQTRHELA